MLKFLLVIQIALFMSACELDMMHPSEFNGNIDKGSKFGVTIGDSIEYAHNQMLADGWELRKNKTRPYVVTNDNPQECHGFIYPQQVEVRVYKDSDRGIVCIANLDDKVIRLSWHFGRGNFP